MQEATFKKKDLQVKIKMQILKTVQHQTHNFKLLLNHKKRFLLIPRHRGQPIVLSDKKTSKNNHSILELLLN